jgi:hypothetical protein
MSTKTAERLIDAEAKGALAALRRARLQAERTALITGTCLIQAVDGKPVRVPPRQGLALNDHQDNKALP